MLITDACLLVMLAGAIGHPGEVMVLDMGEPVFIYDVAHEMRKAYERYDVDIVVTGLRPGEKLDETSGFRIMKRIVLMSVMDLPA